MTPRRARVTTRDIARPVPRRTGSWTGGYRIYPLDVIAVVLGVAVLLAIVWT